MKKKMKTKFIIFIIIYKSLLFIERIWISKFFMKEIFSEIYIFNNSFFSIKLTLSIFNC